MILIDTGPIVAMFDPRDEFHRRARRDFVALENKSMATITPVLSEAFFHLRKPMLRARLFNWLASYNISIPNVDLGSVGRVRNWMDQYAEHEPDFADAALIDIADQSPQMAIWTYDREFRNIWRRPNGSKIPLAV